MPGGKTGKKGGRPSTRMTAGGKKKGSEIESLESAYRQLETDPRYSQGKPSEREI